MSPQIISTVASQYIQMPGHEIEWLGFVVPERNLKLFPPFLCLEFGHQIKYEKLTQAGRRYHVPSCFNICIYCALPRGPPQDSIFIQFSILEGIAVKKHERKIIFIDGQKVEVSNKIYEEYKHSHRKERYFMRDLKRSKIIIEGERITETFGREDSVERLMDTQPQLFVEQGDGPEELLDKKELLKCLTKALRMLTDE